MYPPGYQTSTIRNGRKRNQSADTEKTGVEFWYHTAKEFWEFTQEQIDELKDLRERRSQGRQDQLISALPTKFEIKLSKIK